MQLCLDIDHHKTHGRSTKHFRHQALVYLIQQQASGESATPLLVPVTSANSVTNLYKIHNTARAKQGKQKPALKSAQ
jgi:hypothetical protein